MFVLPIDGIIIYLKLATVLPLLVFNKGKNEGLLLDLSLLHVSGPVKSWRNIMGKILPQGPHNSVKLLDLMKFTDILHLQQCFRKIRALSYKDAANIIDA